MHFWDYVLLIGWSAFCLSISVGFLIEVIAQHVKEIIGKYKNNE